MQLARWTIVAVLCGCSNSSSSDRSEPTANPPANEVKEAEKPPYVVKGPLFVRYADPTYSPSPQVARFVRIRDKGDPGQAQADSLTFTYSEEAELGRAWELVVEIEGGRRIMLLGMSETEVVPMKPPELLRLNILHPIFMTFRAEPKLAAMLDTVQDRTPIVADGALHERIREAALDLRSYEFVSAAQDEKPR